MTRGTLYHRLARLEAAQGPTSSERIVWVENGEPVPEPAPGERLTIVRWKWEDDDTALTAH